MKGNRADGWLARAFAGRLGPREVTNWAVVAAASLGLSGCLARSDDERTDRIVSREEEREVAKVSREFAALYVNRLERGLLTRRDEARLSRVTTPGLRRRLLRKFRPIADARRRSSYARAKLRRYGTCHAGKVRVIPRTPTRVIADPDFTCGIGWGFELTRGADGRWRVASARDARFDRTGRCVAPSCRADPSSRTP